MTLTIAAVSFTAAVAAYPYDGTGSTDRLHSVEAKHDVVDQAVHHRSAVEDLLVRGYDDRSGLALALARPETYRSAPNTAGGSQRVFRAVEPDELADLIGSGRYRNIPGIGDGKYFFPTKQQADAFAEMMMKRNMGGPFCTTSGCIPSNLLRQVEKITPAGEGAAYYIPEWMLPYIDDIIIHGG